MAAERMQIAAVLASLFIVAVAAEGVGAQLASDWMSYGHGGASFDLAIDSEGEGECDGGVCGVYDEENRAQERLLRQVRYYISYGALAANRVPCPPRSGRSYYTSNCYGSGGPVRPYHRGCTVITRCYRDTG